MIHSCDICQSNDAKELKIAENYIRDGDKIHVCKNCGFVYVRERRSPEEVADSWKQIFGDGYTSAWPGTKARLFYVAEWYFQKYTWLGKRLLDIGCGYRHFMDFAKEHGAATFGIEPAGFLGNINPADKQFVETVPIEKNPFEGKKFDVISILWTLENTGDCNAVIEYAKKHLADNGDILIATGSRIGVPFKKPLSAYFSVNPADTHCFRFSMRSLVNLMAKHGFKPSSCNDYQQRDELVCVFKKGMFPFCTESADAIIHFFDEWRKAWP